MTPGREAAVAGALRAAAVRALETCVPASLVLVGGETAFEVLAGLGHPRLVVEGRAGPAGGAGTHRGRPSPGIAVVTKGGSSGDPDLLAALVRDPRGVAA